MHTEDISIRLGSRIRYLRKAKKLTRDQLAEKAQISGKFLYEIENGKTGFTVSVMLRLAEALKVRPDYFFMGEDQYIYDEELRTMLELFGDEDLESLKAIIKIFFDYLNNLKS